MIYLKYYLLYICEFEKKEEKMPLCTEYIVHYKEYDTEEDFKKKTDNFKKGFKIIKILLTNKSTSGHAKRKFLSGLTANQKKRIVVVTVNL